MDVTARHIISLFLNGNSDYSITVMTQEGGAEFLIQNQQIHLITKNANDIWSSLIDDETATIHVRATATSINIGAETLIPNSAFTRKPELGMPPEAPNSKPVDTSDPQRNRFKRRTTAVEDPTPQPGVPKKKTDSLVIIKVPASGVQPYWVGRMEDCDMVIDEPSVSRKHCHLRHEDGVIHLRDNQSLNGCFINDILVTEAQIMPGDFFFLGNVFCTVQLDLNNSKR